MNAKTSNSRPRKIGGGSSLVRGLGVAIVFAVSVTNTIVYARGTTSSGTTSGSDATNGNGVSAGCSLIMLILNLIIAVLTFGVMVNFLYRRFVSSNNRRRLEGTAGAALRGEHYDHQK
jgi:hypothetical protein